MAGLSCDGRSGLVMVDPSVLVCGVVTANVRQEVEDAVRDGRKDCCDAKGNLVCRYSIEQE